MKDLEAIGIGRCCVDNYFQITRSGERIDSVKYSVKRKDKTLGGSVPRILSCLALNSVSSFFIGKVGNKSELNITIEHTLAKNKVAHSLIDGSKTMESSVIFNDDGKLSAIYSEEETESDKIRESEIVSVLTDLKPKCLLLDARHTEAAIFASKKIKGNGGIIFLDPGSTVGSHYNSVQEIEHLKSLISNCDIIVASDSFYVNLAKTKNIYDAFKNLLALGPKLLVATAKNGICYFCTSDFHFELKPSIVKEKGNSFGAGDLFRGFFMIELLSQTDFGHEYNWLSREKIYQSALTGLSAAAWRKAKICLIPPIPKLSEIQNLIPNIECAF